MTVSAMAQVVADVHLYNSTDDNDRFMKSAVKASVAGNCKITLMIGPPLPGLIMMAIV